MSAVVVARGCLDRQVSHAEFFVHRDLRPHAGVTGVLSRALLPGVVPHLTLFRNRMEDPLALAGADIVAARIALVVAHALRCHALAKRRADDDRIARDYRRRL